MGLDSESVRT